MTLVIGLGCLIVAGVQCWLAFKIGKAKHISDPVARLDRTRRLDKASKTLQVVALGGVLAYILVTMLSGNR